MKGFVFILASFAILVGFIGMVSALDKPLNSTCDETDSGKDVFTHGEIKIYDMDYELIDEDWQEKDWVKRTYRNDSCQGASLTEYYCHKAYANHYIANFETVNCTYGCESGACLNESQALNVKERNERKNESNKYNYTENKNKYKLKKGEVKIGGQNLRSELDLEGENNSIENVTLRANLSNGRLALFKIMPQTASQRAIQRLGLKVCSEQNNCTIILKEVGTGNSTKAVYEVKAKKEHSFLWIFKWKSEVKTEIDAEKD